MSEFLIACTALGQNSALKTTHVEEQVGVVFTVHRHKAVLPLYSSDRTGKTVFNVPKHSTAPRKKKKKKK